MNQDPKLIRNIAIIAHVVRFAYEETQVSSSSLAAKPHPNQLGPALLFPNRQMETYL